MTSVINNTHTYHLLSTHPDSGTKDFTYFKLILFLKQLCEVGLIVASFLDKAIEAGRREIP